MKLIQKKHTIFLFVFCFLFLLAFPVFFGFDNQGNLELESYTVHAAWYEINGDWTLKPILLAILWVVTKFIIVAATLFGYVVDAGSFTTAMNHDAIKTSWIAVRDILNIAFILVLLFSAFSTIFQIEKFHVKKVLLTLIIMALLVNFSYPISRFIIDSANIPMYHIATVIFGEGRDWTAVFTEESAFSKLFTPQGDYENIEIRQIMVSILFGFLFLITLFALSLLFLIRFVVLIILVIFSPIGFVAAILPSTKNYADDYWTTLFKNAFFGPIMMFMLAISLFILKAFQETPMSKFSGPNASSVDNETALAQWAFAFVPVVILWGGMIWAQKLGAIGASVVMSKADSFAKKSLSGVAGGIAPTLLFVGDRGTNTLTKGIDRGLGKLGFNFRTNSAYKQIKAVPSAVKKVYWDDKAADRKQEAEDAREIMAARITRGDSATSARKRIMDKKVKDQIEEYKKFGTNRSTLESQITQNERVKSPEKAKAAALLLAEQKNLQAGSLTDAIATMNHDTDGINKLLSNAGSALKNLDEAGALSLRNTLTDENTIRQANPQFDDAQVRQEADRASDILRNSMRDAGRVDLSISVEHAQRVARGTARATRQEVADDIIRPMGKDSLLKQEVRAFQDPNIGDAIRRFAPNKIQALRDDMSTAQENALAPHLP